MTADLTAPGALSPDAAPAAATARVLAQAGFDARAMLRNPEQVLLTIVLPVMVLIGLTRTSIVDVGPGERVDVVTAGVIALAVLSTAFTGQAIGTGFDRRYAVLRLLGTTPLGRAGLVMGRSLAVLAVEAVQMIVLAGVAILGLGWRPSASGLIWAVPIVAVGTATFVAAGLLLAGVVRTEAVLAVANGVWVLMLAAGGVIIPPGTTGRMGVIAQWLPGGALADGLRAAFVTGSWTTMVMSTLVVAAWGAGFSWLAVRTFRWD
jgi:ABC-2 type transport system permease protein